MYDFYSVWLAFSIKNCLFIPRSPCNCVPIRQLSCINTFSAPNAFTCISYKSFRTGYDIKKIPGSITFWKFNYYAIIFLLLCDLCQIFSTACHCNC